MEKSSKNTPLWWVVILLGLIGLAAVVYWWQNREEPPVDNQDEEEVVLTDSATVETDKSILFAVKTITEERKTNDISTKITIDFPATNNKALQESIVDFIVNTLTVDFTWGGNPRPKYQGDRTDGQAIADFFVKDKVREIADERRRDSLQTMAPWNEEIAIKKNYEDDRIVSYFVDFSGSHGGVGDGRVYGITFDKVGGHAVKVLKDPKDPHLKGFLVRYFEKHQSEDILSLYFPEELESHPVPNKAPYITDQGVHFLYQKYEIGPGAMGFVEMIIPLADLSAYLSEESKQLK